MSSLGLDVALEKMDDKIILRLDGRIDTVTSSILEKKINSLVEDSHKLLVLDFNSVDYLSSAGMRLLLSVTKKLKNSGGSLVTFAINDDVMEIIKMAGFDKILNICSIEEEALRFS
jgi:anti-anti-sigma factor